jgi:[ribosomal protein S18]-alanine N-acetyltransferase
MMSRSAPLASGMIANVEPRLQPMTVAQLDEVMLVEQGSYPHPWTRGNFIDSLSAGYWMHTLRGVNAALRGYVVAMPGVAEMHLLNLTVAPAWRRRGLASTMLLDLIDECRRIGAQSLWLEVRPSNHEAVALYAARGFVERGLRRGYYPAAHGTREDALVMSLTLDEGRGDATH